MNMTKKTGLIELHKEPNINFQLNRGLNWGNAEIDDITKVAPKIKNLNDWKKEFLDLATSYDKKGKLSRAMTYYRMAEFFISPGDRDKEKAFNRYMEIFNKIHEEDFEKGRLKRIRIPYKNKYLPGFHFPVSDNTRRKKTLLITLGFDAFKEELYSMANVLRNQGYEIYIFEGPGQGTALAEEKISMIPEWEKPVAAVINYLKLDRVWLLGVSLGGYLGLRAAAYEKRIAGVIAFNVIWDFYDVVSSRRGKSFANAIKFLLAIHAETLLNFLVRSKMKRDSYIKWGVEHGIYVMGVETPYQYFKKLHLYSMKKISHLVTQDVLLTAGREDHFVPVSFFHKQMEALINTRSLTGRIFTEHEQAQSHCQIGNIDLAIHYIQSWLTEK